MTQPDTPLPPIVDLHSHLVPSVDDGSSSIQESLTSLAALYEEGVRTLVTTPHLLLPHFATDAAVDRELDRHRRSFDELVAAARGRSGLPALGLGQEIWAPDGAQLRRVVRRDGIGLGGGRHMLVEFGFELQGSHDDVVREAVDAGRGIVIAHPERYRYLPGMQPLEVMHRWRRLGALLQVNAGSFSGYYGGRSPSPEELAWSMVSEGLVDLVATDHHGTRRVGVSPAEAFDALARRGYLTLAGRAMAEVPGGLLGAEVRSPGEAA